MNKIRSFWKWLSSSKKRKIVAVVFLVLFASVVYFSVTQRSKGTISYQTTDVAKGTVVSTVSSSGQVMTTNILSISTEASGVVKRVYVKDGDTVSIGQKLAEITLDSAGLEKNAQAYSSYINALNGVNSANNSYRSAQASADKVLDEVKGHDNDETLAQKETRTKAEVARDNAYDGLRQAQANLTSATYNYRLTTPIITAPFPGEVGSFNLVEGMVLESSSSTTNINSQRVAVIKGDSLPVISVSLSEVDVPKVEVGQKVIVMIDSIADKTFTGEIATVDRVGTVNNNVVSYIAKIKLDAGSNLILPNMAATANIILDTKTNVLVIPTIAVQSQNGLDTVKILVGGIKESRDVELGLSSENLVEVISGLSEGDKVITASTNTSSVSSAQTQKSVFSTGGFGSSVRIPR